MRPLYIEPSLSVLVLDFLKEEETRRCLESVKRHLLVPHRVIYLHNGPADYPARLAKEGLVDHLIQTKTNNGLGVGTRDLFAACHTWWSLYLQNDQYFARDLTEVEFDQMKGWMGGNDSRRRTIYSISLAGAPCGEGVYSERAHLIQTAMYKRWEDQLHLGCHGAGPYHDGEWREATIQRHYQCSNAVHSAWPYPVIADNGRRAVRQNPDGSLWQHLPDTKELWLKRGPVKESYVYPRFTVEEWEQVIATQSWPDGQIPEIERAESFRVPGWH